MMIRICIWDDPEDFIRLYNPKTTLYIDWQLMVSLDFLLVQMRQQSDFIYSLASLYSSQVFLLRIWDTYCIKVSKGYLKPTHILLMACVVVCNSNWAPAKDGIILLFLVKDGANSKVLECLSSFHKIFYTKNLFKTESVSILEKYGIHFPLFWGPNEKFILSANMPPIFVSKFIWNENRCHIFRK